MSAVATAIVGAAVVAGVTSSMAAGSAADAANNAANQQADSQSQNIALQKEMFDKQVELNEPWQTAGLKALDAYASNPSFNFTYNDMTASPDYKFRKEQGVNALDMSASSRGKLLSGAQDKALLSYGQGLASEEYGNAYNRALQNHNTTQNTQLNLANIGRGAAGQTQNAMQGYASGAGNAITAQGNALAQGRIDDYKATLKELIVRTNLATGKVNISRDELQTLFRYCNDKVPESPNQFTTMLTHHRIYTTKVRIGTKSVYGVQVKWADLQNFGHYVKDHFTPATKKVPTK